MVFIWGLQTAFSLNILTWTGAINTNWDETTANWLEAGTPVTFQPQNNVAFNDGSSGSGLVNIAVNVTPGSMTASNSAENYTLSGSGIINGTTGLTKNGTGTFTLSGANTYSGATVVNAGILAFTTASLASGPCTLADGATVELSTTGANSEYSCSALTLGNSVGATLGFDLGSFGNPALAPWNVTGTLAVNGTVTINVADGMPQVGAFSLIQYGAKTGSGHFVLGSVPPGLVATLVNNVVNNSIDLMITSVPSPTNSFLVYQGLTNTSLGQATLTVSSNQLTVGNIGNSGQDGVAISLLQTEGFTSLYPVDPTVPVGAQVLRTFIGSGSGGSNVTLVRDGFVQTAQGFASIIDFSGLGSPTYTATVYNGSAVVMSASGLSGNVVDFTVSAQSKHKSKYKFPLGISWNFGYADSDSPETALWTIAGVGTNVAGDWIEFTPDVVPTNPVPVAEVTVTGSGVSQFEILGEWITLFGLDHQGLGQAVLQPQEDPTQLTITNIGSSGQDGVETALNPGYGLESSWLPLDADGTLPTGAYLQIQLLGAAVGVSNGVLSSLTSIKIGTSNYVTSADFPAVGVVPVTLLVYKEGTLVAQVSESSGGALFSSSIIAASGGDYQSYYYSEKDCEGSCQCSSANKNYPYCCCWQVIPMIAFPYPTPINLTNGLVQGDTILMVPEAHIGTIGSVAGQQILAVGVPSLTITAESSLGTAPPVARFTASPTNGPAPLQVSFADTSDGPPTSYSWAFGDGNTSTNENPSNTYLNPGTYSVQLTATNTAGCSTYTMTIVVVSPSPVVYQGLSNNALGNATLAMANGDLIVSNLSSSGQDGVSISVLTNLTGLAVGWQTLDVSNTLPIGAYVRAQAIGPLNGVDGALGAVQVTKAGTSNYTVTADFSPLGASNYVVTAYLAGNVVAQMTNEAGVIVGGSDEPPYGFDEETACCLFQPYISTHWPPGTTVSLTGGPTVTCDALLISLQNVSLAGPPTALQVMASQVPALAITGINIAPSMNNISFDGKNITLRWLGDSTLQQSSDLLLWSNVSGATSPFVAPATQRAQFYDYVPGTPPVFQPHQSN